MIKMFEMDFHNSFRSLSLNITDFDDVSHSSFPSCHVRFVYVLTELNKTFKKEENFIPGLANPKIVIYC